MSAEATVQSVPQNPFQHHAEKNLFPTAAAVALHRGESLRYGDSRSYRSPSGPSKPMGKQSFHEGSGFRESVDSVLAFGVRLFLRMTG